MTHSEELGVYENARKRENKWPWNLKPLLRIFTDVYVWLDVSRCAYARVQMYVDACKCMHSECTRVSMHTCMHVVVLR